MNEATEKQKDAVAKDVIDRVLAVCKLYNINYLALDKSMQSLLIACYLAGVEMITDILKDKPIK